MFCHVLVTVEENCVQVNIIILSNQDAFSLCSHLFLYLWVSPYSLSCYGWKSGYYLFMSLLLLSVPSLSPSHQFPNTSLSQNTHTHNCLDILSGNTRSTWPIIIYFYSSPILIIVLYNYFYMLETCTSLNWLKGTSLLRILTENLLCLLL